MPNFGTRFVDGWDRATDHVLLAVVPLLTALLSFDEMARVLAHSGGYFGFQLFGLPLGIVDVWQFVSLPTGSGVSVRSSSILGVAVGLVVETVLGAGYFGSIRSLLVDGEFDFVENVERYLAPFFGIAVVVAGVNLLLGLVTVVAPALGLVLILGFFVASYLFYATPYLVVLRDLHLVPAAARSYDLAVGGGPYLAYALGYAVFVFLASLVASAFVVNLGLLGILVGAVFGAPVGLALNVATMRFVADLDEDAPDLGSWGTDDGSPPDEGRPDPDITDEDVPYDRDDDNVTYGLDEDAADDD